MHRLWLKHPILSLVDIEILKRLDYRGWKTYVLDCSFPAIDGPAGLLTALDKICKDAELHSQTHQILIITDKYAGPDKVPISSILALGTSINYIAF